MLRLGVKEYTGHYLWQYYCIFQGPLQYAHFMMIAHYVTQTHDSVKIELLQFLSLQEKTAVIIR